MFWGRGLFVQIDMVLTFHFRQGLPRKCLSISQKNHPRVGTASPRQLWVDSRGFDKDISWEVPDENEGKDHIYLDKHVP